LFLPLKELEPKNFNIAPQKRPVSSSGEDKVHHGQTGDTGCVRYFLPLRKEAGTRKKASKGGCIMGTGLGLPSEDAVKVAVELNVVLVHVGEKVVCSQHLANLHQLVIVVVSMEKRLLFENLFGAKKKNFFFCHLVLKYVLPVDNTMLANMQPRLQMSSE